MDSVRLDGESRFKAPDFKTLVTLKRAVGKTRFPRRYRGEEKFFSC